MNELYKKIEALALEHYYKCVPMGWKRERTRLHVLWIFIYNCKRSRKLAYFERIRVHEKKFSLSSMKMTILLNTVD